MKNTFSLSLLILLLAVFTGCNPDDDDNNNGNNGNSDFEENFGSEVSRDFMGQIINTDNQPVQNATVRIGSATAQTDANGIFILNNAQVHTRFAYITATKAGYIDGSRALVPTAGRNSIKIMLIPAATIATVASGQESEVSIPSGTKVVFDGAFEDEDGNPYSGNVSVSMYHLESSDPNFTKLMPGMLYAETENGNQAALKTFGMLNVELRGSGGAKLQIADGHTAEITMKIDAAQMATAPATIPLWHFDDHAGYWKEDGAATKQGNFYVGEVAHFSWWNCDAPFETVSLQVTVVDSDQHPVANAMVTLSFSDSSYATGGYSNTEGLISGLIPANQTLTMTVYDSCGGVASTSQIGPFSSDTVLPDLVLPSSLGTVLLEGTLLECDNSNVSNGYVTLNYAGNYTYVPVNNGAFSFSILVCNSVQPFTLQGFDYDNLQQTDSISYTYTAPVTNIGTLVACTSVTEFISYQIDSNPVVLLIQDVGGGLDGVTYLQVSGSSVTQQGLSVYGNINGPGTYTTSTLSIEGNGIYVSSAIPNDVVFTVTSIGNVGEYIDLTFSGTYIDNGVHTVVGTAHVIRNY